MSIFVLIVHVFSFVFFKHKTAYDLRIVDWSSDLCSSDLHGPATQLKDQRWALSFALFHKLACDSTKLNRLLLRICAAYIVHWHSRRGCLSKSVTLSHVIFENTPCSSQTIKFCLLGLL